jgi:hypothetical protein
MTLLLIIFSTLIVVVSILFSIYTSVNSGASKFERWFDKLINNKPD